MTDQPSSTADVSVADKGKGKAPEDEMIDMEEDLSGASESSEEEHDEDVEVEGDISQENLEEIDPSNIVPKRTRGKKIDYSKVPITADDGEEEDEEDEDFEDPKNGETEDVEMKD